VKVADGNDGRVVGHECSIKWLFPIAE